MARRARSTLSGQLTPGLAAPRGIGHRNKALLRGNAAPAGSEIARVHPKPQLMRHDSALMRPKAALGRHHLALVRPGTALDREDLALMRSKTALER